MRKNDKEEKKKIDLKRMREIISVSFFLPNRLEQLSVLVGQNKMRLLFS